MRQTGMRMLAAAMLPVALAASAESPLYETGPAQDSSFVRFLNATGSEIAITAAKGSYRLALPARDEQRLSKFHPAVAGRKLVALVQAGGRSTPVEVTTKPGEYVTVAVTSAGPRLIREASQDFSASRASISLANADPACEQASLTGGAANVAIFEGVKPYEARRRLVNPVRLSAQLACGGKVEAAAVDFGALQPGERYTAIVLPGTGARQALVVRDATL